jgi:hypothetical protein
MFKIIIICLILKYIFLTIMKLIECIFNMAYFSPNILMKSWFFMNVWWCLMMFDDVYLKWNFHFEAWYNFIDCLAFYDFFLSYFLDISCSFITKILLIRWFKLIIEAKDKSNFIKWIKTKFIQEFNHEICETIEL